MRIKRITIGRALLLFTLLLSSLCGCDDDNSDSGAAAGVNVTGIWYGRGSSGGIFTANVVQSGSDVTGTITQQQGYTGQIQGHISGYEFYMHIVWAIGGFGDYMGIIRGNAIEGTFTERYGNYIDRGTFTAFRK